MHPDDKNLTIGCCVVGVGAVVMFALIVFVIAAAVKWVIA